MPLDDYDAVRNIMLVRNGCPLVFPDDYYWQPEEQ